MELNIPPHPDPKFPVGSFVKGFKQSFGKVIEVIPRWSYLLKRPHYYSKGYTNDLQKTLEYFLPTDDIESIEPYGYTLKIECFWNGVGDKFKKSRIVVCDEDWCIPLEEYLESEMSRLNDIQDKLIKVKNQIR